MKKLRLRLLEARESFWLALALFTTKRFQKAAAEWTEFVTSDGNHVMLTGDDYLRLDEHFRIEALKEAS